MLYTQWQAEAQRSLNPNATNVLAYPLTTRSIPEWWTQVKKKVTEPRSTVVVMAYSVSQLYIRWGSNDSPMITSDFQTRVESALQQGNKDSQLYCGGPSYHEERFT